MGTRRVVTGHTPDGTAVIVSDEQIASYPIGALGSAVTSLWGRDDPPHFPDDGARPSISTAFPPVGGSRLAIMELAPRGDDFDEFVRDELATWADPKNPGMHRSPSIDYDIVLAGTVGLELDAGPRWHSVQVMWWCKTELAIVGTTEEMESPVLCR